MDRRAFLRLGSLFVGAAAVAPELLIEPEPVRRYWQVPRNAPVGSLRMRDPSGFRRSFGAFPITREEVLAEPPTGIYASTRSLWESAKDAGDATLSGTRLALMDQAARDRDAYWAELNAQHRRAMAEHMRAQLSALEAQYDATLRDIADNIAAFDDKRVVIG